MYTISSAPGKIILFGEHAVVGGEPALATCVSLRTFCGVKKTEETEIVLELQSLGEAVRLRWEAAAVAAIDVGEGTLTPELSDRLSEVAGANLEGVEMAEEHTKALRAFLLLYRLCGVTGGMYARVWSTLPVGAGLGSSAAFSAAVCGALWRLGAGEKAILEKNVPSMESKDLLNKWTYEAERVLHGNPSGIDNSVAIYGGALSFVKGQGITQLKSMSVLPLLLVDTRVPRSTQKLVSGVLERKAAFPKIMG